MDPYLVKRYLLSLLLWALDSAFPRFSETWYKGQYDHGAYACQSFDRTRNLPSGRDGERVQVRQSKAGFPYAHQPWEGCLAESDFR